MAISPPKVFNMASGLKFQGGGGGLMRVESRVGVQAPAQTIWDILYDIEGWSAWNPLYVEASGKIRIGGPLALTQAVDGRPRQAVQAIVQEWVPLEQLHWRTTVFGGLVRAVHYVEIEVLGPTNCLVSNGEIYGGLLAGMHLKRSRRPLRLAFEAMNAALKARAEADWQAAQAAPISARS